MENISWLDYVTNEEVLRRVNEDRKILNARDVTRFGLGGHAPPPKDVAAASNWNGNRSFLHGCFGHHAAVG